MYNKAGLHTYYLYHLFKHKILCAMFHYTGMRLL